MSFDTGAVLMRYKQTYEAVPITDGNRPLIETWLSRPQIDALRDAWQDFEHNWFVRPEGDPDPLHVTMMTPTEIHRLYTRI